MKNENHDNIRIDSYFQARLYSPILLALITPTRISRTRYKFNKTQLGKDRETHQDKISNSFID